MRIHPFVAAVVVLTSSAIALASDPQKPPASTGSTSDPRTRAARQPGGTIIVGTSAGWQMADEERIVKRTAASMHPANRLSSESAAERGYHESIDGRRNPELFLPYELFDYLLVGFNTSTKRAENAHRLYDPKIQASGYDVDSFWATVRSVAQPYLNTREQHHNQRGHTFFTSSTGNKTFVPIYQDVCSARLSALDDARRLLGGKNFDRLLYSVVAPNVGQSSGGDAPDRADQLRYMARGCK